MFKQSPFRSARNVVGISSLSSSLAHRHRHWDLLGHLFISCWPSVYKRVDTKASLLDNWLLHQEEEGALEFWASVTQWLRFCGSGAGWWLRAHCQGLPVRLRADHDFGCNDYSPILFHRVLPLNHGIVIWGQKIHPRHQCAAEWDCTDRTPLWTA